MNVYKIHISESAQDDLYDLYYTILLDFKAPLTAFKYLQELKDTIKSLSKNAESYQIQTHKSLRKYGINILSINYKKVTTIYTVHANLVYIHRIIPQNLIVEK